MTQMIWVSMTQNDQHHTVLRTQRAGEVSWVEHHGDAMCRWINPECWGDLTPTSAQLVHDCMEGWHTCVLHASDLGERVAILPSHPDFELINNLHDVR
jgi:hypothetical protein